jgi:hypothetical protein
MKYNKSDILFGIVGILSFSLNIAYILKTWNKAATVDYKELLIALSASIAVLIIAFIAFSILYTKKINTYADMIVSAENQSREIAKKELILKHTFDYSHNIFHYYRNILYKLDCFIAKNTGDTFDAKKFEELLADFESYMATLTSNLQSYLSLLTEDKCSVSIKIVKEINGDRYVKTFYRDADSYRKRRESDFYSDGNYFIYRTRENTAFDVITNEEHLERAYVNDNLLNDKHYNNMNPRWKDLYLATAVVPISVKIKDKTRNVLGVLCVDNFKGGLSNENVENFLSGIGKLLFNLFKKYDRIISLASLNGVSNERSEFYTTWNIRG